VAAGDIVPVPGDSFEQTLASASPDMLREMIRGFAQRMMDAEVEVRCNAGYGEVTADTLQQDINNQLSVMFDCALVENGVRP